MSNLPVADKTYTILELNNTVRALLRGEFPEYIWVCGEIKDLRASRSKQHMYFDLVQKHSEGHEVIAKVSAAIFAGRRERICKRIEEAQGMFELKNDIEVRFLCQVDLYPKSGQYSIIIVDIDPVYTLGRLAQNRLRIIEELRSQGLLDKNKSTQLVAVPLRIGLVTALDSAAYHDFVSECSHSGYGFRLFVYDCYMQGRKTEDDVVGAITCFARFKKDAIDAIVITRGGGSTADLSWFDNKRIASSIAQCPLPVVTALGHQINITISDLVAHTSLKTPTKAAQFFIEKINEAESELDELGAGILTQAARLVDDSKKALQTHTLRIDSCLNRYFKDHHRQLTHLRALITSAAAHFVKNEAQSIRDAFKNIRFSIKNMFEREYSALRAVEDKVALLNPRNVLRRGYSISLKNNKAVTSSRQLEEGERFATVFYKGSIESCVTQIKEENE